MNDKNKIVAGLVIFVIIFTFPIWYGAFAKVEEPKPVLSDAAKKAGYCVRPKVLMKKEHIEILDGWRNSVVREAYRIYTNEDGKEFNMSLSNTCLGCHDNKVNFCDKCHNYASVRPYCWDCHINPKEEGK